MCSILCEREKNERYEKGKKRDEKRDRGRGERKLDAMPQQYRVAAHVRTSLLIRWRKIFPLVGFSLSLFFSLHPSQFALRLLQIGLPSFSARAVVRARERKTSSNPNTDADFIADIRVDVEPSSTYVSRKSNEIFSTTFSISLLDSIPSDYSFFFFSFSFLFLSFFFCSFLIESSRL